MAASASGGASGRASLPFIGSGEAHGNVSGELEHSRETQYRPIGVTPENLSYVTSEIKKCEKRIVIEDFHYLTEEEKRRFAFDLKAMYEAGVFLLIIGVWAQQNLLSYYNGDLVGRVQEIDLEWEDNELLEVIDLGEKKLNISFSDHIKSQVVSDASGNVGLLQRLMETICRQAGIMQRSNEHQVIDNFDLLERSRNTLCNDEAQRYTNVVRQIAEGKSRSTWEMYKEVTKVLVVAKDDELIDGITNRQLQDRISVFSRDESPQVGVLTNALNGLNSLQVNRNISPPLFYYNESTRTVQLVDREFLFYRKYGNPHWPWEDED